jgi:hypothetical protein
VRITSELAAAAQAPALEASSDPAELGRSDEALRELAEGAEMLAALP